MSIKRFTEYRYLTVGIICISLAANLLLAGCGGNTLTASLPPASSMATATASSTAATAGAKTGELTESEVRAFADPVAENLLQAMNTGDYEKYSADFDTALKKNITKGIFDFLNTKKIEVVGNYVSHEFVKMTPKEGSVAVIYKANFTREPAGVTVTVIVKEIAEKIYVSGLNFDSPLMRAGNCC